MFFLKQPTLFLIQNKCRLCCACTTTATHTDVRYCKLQMRKSQQPSLPRTPTSRALPIWKCWPLSSRSMTRASVSAAPVLWPPTPTTPTPRPPSSNPPMNWYVANLLAYSCLIQSIRTIRDVLCRWRSSILCKVPSLGPTPHVLVTNLLKWSGWLLKY